MANDGDLKVLAQFEDEIEACIVKGMLEANGINAGVLGDNVASTLMHGLGRGQWKVVVNPEDFDAAEELLNTPIEEEDEGDE